MIYDIGAHRVRHGDVTDPTMADELLQGESAHILYSDPPWGDGNIKFWATMNKKMTGETVEPAPLDRFLSAVFDYAEEHVTDYMLIEYGVRWADEVVRRGENAGFTHVDTIDILYRGGGKLLPLHLHTFSRAAAYPEGYAEAVQGAYGYPCTKLALAPVIQALQARQGAEVVVTDPCCGMGYTAQVCVDTGASFRGNELNRARLQKTIDRLSK